MYKPSSNNLTQYRYPTEYHVILQYTAVPHYTVILLNTVILPYAYRIPLSAAANARIPLLRRGQADHALQRLQLREKCVFCFVGSVPKISRGESPL